MISSNSFPKFLATTTLALLVGAFAWAEEAPDKVAGLAIEDSSTTTALAKCDLSVGTLIHKDQTLNGSYAIKVSPFAFKNDRGSLLLAMSDEVARKLAKGEPVEFAGVATSAKDAKTKAIKGKTRPETNAHGAVSFTVTTEDGDLLFNTSYKIVAK